MTRRRDVQVNSSLLWNTARTLRESQPKRGKGPMTSQEWTNRKLYGTCTVCGQTLDENRWEVGDRRTGIYYCCSQGCAQYLYDASAEAWNRSVYGECASPACRNVVREGSDWGLEVRSDDDVLTTIWTCSEKCARNVRRRMPGNRRGLLSWLGL